LKDIKNIKDEHVLFYQLVNFIKSERFNFWFLLTSHVVLIVMANHALGYNPDSYSSGKEWIFSLDIGHSIKILLSYFLFTKLSEIARK
jgi:hypothetical protein